MLIIFIIRWLSMYIRSVCAVLDFNANVERPNKIVDGEIVHKLKVIYTYNFIHVQCTLYRVKYTLGHMLNYTHTHIHMHLHTNTHAHAHSNAHAHLHANANALTHAYAHANAHAKLVD